MEVFKKYLDGLPKMSYDKLETELLEGDIIYRVVGNSSDFGNINIMRIGKGTGGRLCYFLENFKTGEMTEVPCPNLEYLLHNMATAFEELRKKVNEKHNPLLIRDATERKLGVQRGELIIRYILKKGNGKEYEIVI
jgi:hypothetical protein